MYNERPIVKLYEYTFQFELVAFIDDYESISITENKYESGELTLTINYNLPNAKLFAKKLFMQIDDDPERFFVIYTCNDVSSEGGKGSQIRTITAYDCRYLLHQRYITNLNNESNWTYTGTGEACIRYLIDSQCGENVEEKRRLPINNDLDSTMILGKVYTVSEAYSNLYEVIVTIATQTEIGWGIIFENNELHLKIYEGENLNSKIFLSTEFDTLQNGSLTDSLDSYSNAVYVGGKGEGKNKDLYVGEKITPNGYLLLDDGDDFLIIDKNSKLILSGEEPKGLDRFESFDNANSLDNENAYINESKAILSQYGQTVESSGNFVIKSQYEYRKDFKIGDFISLIFNDTKNVVEVLGVTETWQWGSYEIYFELGKPLVDLSRQLEMIVNNLQTYQATAKETKTSGKTWYNLPESTEQPKEDIVYDTIGFTGDIGALGSIFKLYFDDNKNGAKNYHVYIKDVTGTGKITLTTGVIGTNNLLLNSGTYVTIITVDEDGNIYSATNMGNNSIIEQTPYNISRLSQLQNDTNYATSNQLANLQNTLTNDFQNRLNDFENSLSGIEETTSNDLDSLFTDEV